MLSRFVTALLPRSKRLLISWLQSPSTSDFGTQENKVYHCFHFFPFNLSWSDGTRLGEVSFHSNPIPKKGNAKECSNYHTTAVISHASKVMLKILQARLQQYMNCELPDVQTGFIKGRGTRDQIASIRWITEKAREFQKNICFCFINYAKVFDCVDHHKLWKILKEMGIPNHLTCLLRNL